MDERFCTVNNVFVRTLYTISEKCFALSPPFVYTAVSMVNFPLSHDNLFSLMWLISCPPLTDAQCSMWLVHWRYSTWLILKR